MHTVKRAVSRDFFCEKRASDSKELGTGLKHRDERRGALGSSSWQAQQAALSSQRLTGFVQVAVDEKVELISAEGHPAGHSGAQACSGAASAENCASRELNKVLPAKSWSEAFPPSLVSFPPLAAPDSHWSSSRSDAASDSLGAARTKPVGSYERREAHLDGRYPACLAAATSDCVSSELLGLAAFICRSSAAGSARARAANNVPLSHPSWQTLVSTRGRQRRLDGSFDMVTARLIH